MDQSARSEENVVLSIMYDSLWSTIQDLSLTHPSLHEKKRQLASSLLRTIQNYQHSFVSSTKEAFYSQQGQLAREHLTRLPSLDSLVQLLCHVSVFFVT